MLSLIATVAVAQATNARPVKPFTNRKPGVYRVSISLPKPSGNVRQKKLLDDVWKWAWDEAIKVMNLADQEKKRMPSGFREYILVITTKRTFYSSRLNSIVVSLGTYTGGAHSLTSYRSWTRGFASGDFADLTLEDFYSRGANYKQQVAYGILDQLRSNNKATEVQNGKRDFSTADLSTFAVTPAGLEFYFAPYDLGPFSSGSFIVEVSVDKLGVDFRRNLILSN
jgi:hypothetical protein